MDSGHSVEGKILTGKALRDALCEKLHEEADEVSGALTHQELVEEIGDVKQVLDDLCHHEDITASELKQVQKVKRDRKGGFREGRFIETVTMPNDDDKWVAYCRKNPGKYPEVTSEESIQRDVFTTKPELALGRYRHYKGGEYEVLMLACNEATHEWVVVYKALYKHDGPDIWTRNYNVFVEDVLVDGKKVKRFQPV